MSPITRRAFLQQCGTIAGSLTLAACSQSNSPLSRPLLGTEVLVWSTSTHIDPALARWRRINTNINVRRQIITQADLREAIQSPDPRRYQLPDIVIADRYTFMSTSPYMWRQFTESSEVSALVPASIAHAKVDSQSLFALPITVNPLKLWYNSTLMSDALGISEPVELETQLGGLWSTMIAFLGQLHRSNPVISPMASCFDDLVYPHFVSPQPPTYDVVRTCIELAQNRTVGRAVHFSGEWFDLVARAQIAMVVGGRWMGEALRRTMDDSVSSPWRTLWHPMGVLLGPSMLAAIPLQSSQYEHAERLVQDLSFDEELQILISEASKSLPALASAYTRSLTQSVDPVNPSVNIADDWDVRTVIPQAPDNSDHFIRLQKTKSLIYAWQQNTIATDDLMRDLAEVFVAS
ncbi:MAG: twin-arginine translocation signal domain-containing protein [Chloroflexi bacterium]|nr:twin-arginine translocation signal domain-containing protein [Chloroflexota bacterium]